MPPKRNKRESQLQTAFDNHGFDIPYGHRGDNTAVSVPENTRSLLTDLGNYLKYSDTLTNEELDEVIEMVGTEATLAELMDVAKKRDERAFAAYVDDFLDLGDELDQVEDQKKALNARVEEQKEKYSKAKAAFQEYDFTNSGMLGDYDTMQKWVFTVFGTEAQPKLNEADFEGYKEAGAHVTSWLDKKIDKSKRAQKTAMSEDMNNTNALIGTIIDIFRAGARFSGFDHKKNVADAEKNLSDFAKPLKDLLLVLSVKMNETNKAELYTDRDTIGKIGAYFRKKVRDLEGHLKIENDKLAHSHTGDKKAEHSGNIKYIGQDIKALNHLGALLSSFPHYAYEVDANGEFVRMPGNDKGGADPLSFFDDFGDYAKEYKIREEKFASASDAYLAIGRQLENLEEDSVKPAKEKYADAEKTLHDKYTALRANRKKADSLMKAVHARVEFKEAEKRRAAELAKKNKEEADRLQKQEAEAQRKQAEEKKRQEAEAQRKLAEEAEKNKPKKTNAPSGKMINANIYRKELLRLTKELTAKTYRMGQNNTRGFMQLRDTLTGLLDAKASYDGEDMMPSDAFTAGMNGINEACRQYADDHREGRLNDNQLLRLKIMSRMMNVLNMAKEGIDPASYEGRKRMLSEKVNNAECIDILKDKNAGEANKQKARDRMLNYLNIGRVGMAISEKNPAFQNYMERFTVKHPEFSDQYDQQQYEYEQEAVDLQKQADVMLRELKKPGARLLKEINNPQKAVEKTI